MDWSIPQQAQVVAKKLLEDILPRYGFPTWWGQTTSIHITVESEPSQAPGVWLQLHCAYTPQSSGKVERMNRTLKETLNKLTIETSTNWVTLLPFALYRVRNSPYKMGLTPYEIMFGTPPPIIPNFQSNLIAEMDDWDLLDTMQNGYTKKFGLPKLRALYESRNTPEHHRFFPRD